MTISMAFVSITRLRIRSWRFMPAFFIHTWRSVAQVRRAAGFVGGSLLADRSLAFWTVTVWDGESAMRGYMVSGAHMKAMPRLLDWCDEASVAHWTHDDALPPTWVEADRRMRAEGRPSKVRLPGRHHADQSYPAPLVSGALPIVARPRAS